MAISNDKWQTGKEANSPAGKILEYLQDQPGTAYNVEQIADGVGIVNIGGKYTPHQGFEAEQKGGEFQNEHSMALLYFHSLLSILVEIGEVEVRAFEEESSVTQKEHDVLYYRAVVQD